MDLAVGAGASVIREGPSKGSEIYYCIEFKGDAVRRVAKRPRG